MKMVTLNEYAQFSGIVYAKTQPNRLPIPSGWVEERPWQADTLLGFSAGVYKKGSEIVISYTGTNGEFQGALDYLVANGPAGIGTFSLQVMAAINLYLEVRDANPGATISFTGHSLGGGLAALMAVFFDKQATTFAPAPFKASAGNVATMGLYLAAIATQGKTDSAFTDYVTNISALYTAREANVEAHTVVGEVLVDVFGRLGTIVDPARDYFYDAGNSVSFIGLHSMLLHAAVIRSEDYRQAVVALDSVLPAINDESLYASNAQFLSTPDFMHRLMQHEWSWTGATSASPLNRFAADLLKLAPTTYGTASGTGMSEALVAAAMEYRYFKDAASATQLFTLDSYGLHFKYSDIGASSYKSLPKLTAAVNAFLTPEELALLNGKLLKQDAWHIQSGLGGLILNATGADNDAAIGGANSDGIWAGAGNDILIGGANNDVLAGEAGNDYLLGGIGFDTYLLNPGDGYDTILDSDGSGVIMFDALQAKGSTGVSPDKWYQLDTDNWIDAQNGITYTRVAVAGDPQLFIRKGDNNVLVKEWSEGELEIALGVGSTPPDPATLLTGLASANYLEAASGGQRVEGLAGADMIMGSGFSGADHLLGGDGNDWIVGNGGADLIEGGLGNDYISGIDINSQAYGGDGNDLLTAAVAEGVQLLNIGNPDIPGLTADIIWADAQSGFGLSAFLTYDSAGNLDLGHGSVPLAPYGGASALGGGWGYSMAFGDGSWAITYTHPTLAPGGKPPTGYWEHFIAPVSLTEGVFLFGEAGDDLLVGNDGADYLDGGSGQDQLFGHAGNDVLDGGTEADTLAGGDGQDILLGGDHNDSLYGEQQDDVLIGGSGDDVLWGDSPNVLLAAWDGADYIGDGSGADAIPSARWLCAIQNQSQNHRLTCAYN